MTQQSREQAFARARRALELRYSCSLLWLSASTIAQGIFDNWTFRFLPYVFTLKWFETAFGVFKELYIVV
jgi:hypothetical protein